MPKDHDERDIIDEDLYEEIDEEELTELVEKERRKALERAQSEQNQKPKRPFPKWAFWLIAFVMVFNVIALLPKTFSVPAIDFLITSARLSAQDDIQSYKESVVVIETDEKTKGTGFSVSADGKIITNHHVVEGEKTVTVAFPDNTLFSGEVKATYPSVDLAVVEVEGENLPHLRLADNPEYKQGKQVYFIGNPLNFNGIANEGTVIEDITLNDWKKSVIMMEAPVYRGNSGSPVINQNGKVIGVVFATLDHEKHGRVGLFIPIEYLQSEKD
ncbi:S1C family serine protease [Virgibacillus kekensis]|uniref:S1C family serine protease n=1 Tax=Virgibacillus kekensis TaxID=202261 RepID=A0ABV9DK57_9BACI